MKTRIGRHLQNQTAACLLIHPAGQRRGRLIRCSSHWCCLSFSSNTNWKWSAGVSCFSWLGTFSRERGANACISWKRLSGAYERAGRRRSPVHGDGHGLLVKVPRAQQVRAGEVGGVEPPGALPRRGFHWLFKERCGHL